MISFIREILKGVPPIVEKWEKSSKSVEKREKTEKIDENAYFATCYAFFGTQDVEFNYGF